jgi:hypothetical protein
MDINNSNEKVNNRWIQNKRKGCREKIVYQEK